MIRVVALAGLGIAVAAACGAPPADPGAASVADPTVGVERLVFRVDGMRRVNGAL